MDTNEITGQTQPGQNTQAEQLRPLTLTVPATSEPEPTAETMEPVPNDTPPMPEPPATETPRLYDPGVVARIAQCLSELLDPAYILLFGSMAGGTPHSDALSYDLLIATHDTPQYNWLDVRRYLKMKMPGAGLSVRQVSRPRCGFCFQARRIGSMNCQLASSESRRAYSVESPSITSNSSRS